MDVFQDDGFYLAFPFDMDGRTLSRTVEEVSEMTADWLQMEMEHRAMHGISFPKATFGNTLRHDDEYLLAAVNTGTDTVDKVTATKAAQLLSVALGHVSQMGSSPLARGTLG